MPYRSVLRPGLFAQQCVVVTGAGSGIGRCIAHELASLGATVALLGRDAAKLETVASEIAADGGTAFGLPCDIRDEERVTATVADVLARAGRIDGLVNNAGGQFPMPLAALSLKGWDAVIRTNLTGGFLMAREVFDQWMGEHGGAIVNIVADMWGSMPMMGHSGAARAGMVSFTETAACEWAPAGVRVNAVAPGYIASSGLDKYGPEVAEHIREVHQGVPLYRLGTESEVSAAVCFLLGEGAAFITGTTLRVDGGRPNARTAWPPIPPERGTRYEGFHRATLPAVLRNKKPQD